jgi:hypothetical protein
MHNNFKKNPLPFLTVGQKNLKRLSVIDGKAKTF